MSLLRAPLNLWSYRERRICGNTGAGNENFYNFVKISTTERGAGDPWDMGAGAESFVMSRSVLPKLSDARDAQQFPLDIIFQKAMMMMLVPHKEDNYPVLKLL